MVVHPAVSVSVMLTPFLRYATVIPGHTSEYRGGSHRRDMSVSDVRSHLYDELSSDWLPDTTAVRLLKPQAGAPSARPTPYYYTASRV